MKNNIFCKKNICFFIYTVFTTILLSIGHILSDINRFATGFTLIIVAVALYFCLQFSVVDKNWLDIRAVFHASWVATIGLATLRLMDYQEKWQVKTWFCLAIAYFVFQIGSHMGISFGEPLFNKLNARFKKVKTGKISFEIKENRYFWICVITTLIGIVCFSINVAIRGYIPCFSDDINAYMNFYTKFHIFSVASTGVSAFCYHCMVTQKLSKIKKAILALCILYETFLFPTMIVSRGVFLASALALTVAVFYIHKKKFLVLVGCLVVIAGIYYGTSLLRNYTDYQLESFFEPSKIQIDDSKKDDALENEDDLENGDAQGNIKVFSLSPKVSFIYSYLTVSHDNFNEAVENSKEYALGVHQFKPFNTIFRFDWVDELLAESEYYLVRPHLNTVNFIGLFYYDFHEWGIMFFMLLWSFVFGVVQKFAVLSKTPFMLLVLGNVLVPVALCFFTPWMSVFSQWLLWGVVLIFALASSLNIKKSTY